MAIYGKCDTIPPRSMGHCGIGTEGFAPGSASWLDSSVKACRGKYGVGRYGDRLPPPSAGAGGGPVRVMERPSQPGYRRAGDGRKPDRYAL